jgi:hypothetical protein
MYVGWAGVWLGEGVIGKGLQMAIRSHDDSDIPSMNAFLYTESLLNGSILIATRR